MVYGIYSSAAGLQVNQYRQDLLANNLANLATAGFKQDLAVVRERRIAAREGLADPSASDPTLEGLTGGSLVAPTYTLFEQGPVERTNNPLDVALSGEGFFAVQAGGQTRYTRDGRFTLDNQGRLVMTTGKAVALDQSGQPIVVPEVARDRVRIDADGQVRAGDETFGRMQVVKFDDLRQLRKVGGNLLTANSAVARPFAGDLLPGSVEGSNVDPTRTMVAMIEATRAYQLNATLAGLADSTLGRAVNDIARIR
jgi:flagellar basal-body rod protein FlgG